MAKQLVVTIRAQDQMTPIMRRVAASILSFGQNAAKVVTGPLAGLTRSLFSVKGLLVGLGAGLVAGRLASSFNDAARTLDDMAKASQRLGIGVEQLSSLKFTADLANVSFEELLSGIQTAQKNLGQFTATGKGRASDAIRLLGVNVRDTTGRLRDMTELLPELADAINAVGDPSQRQFLVQRIFGESGSGFLNLLAEGGDRLRSFGEEAKRLNAIFTPEQAAIAEEYRDSIARVQAAWLGLRVNLLTKVGPALTDILNKMASFIAAIPEMVGNLMGNIRAALGTGPEAAQARRMFEQLFDELTDVVGTGIRELVRVVIAAVLDGTKVMSDLLGPVMRRLGIELMVDPLVQAAEAISPAFASKLKGLQAGLEASFGVLDTKAIDDALDKAFGAGSRSKVAILDAALQMTRPFGDVAAAMDSLLGASEALAKTALPELTRALRDFNNQVGVLNKWDWRQFSEGMDETWAQFIQHANDARAAGQALMQTITRSISGELSDAIVDSISGLKSFEEAFREWGSNSLREISRVITQMLVLRAISGIAGAFGGSKAPGSVVGGGVGPGGPSAAGGFFNVGLHGGGRIGDWHRFAPGGFVPGPSVNRDIVPALLTPGEYVLNRRAAQSVGYGTLDRVNRGSAPAVAPVTVIVNQTNNFGGGPTKSALGDLQKSAMDLARLVAIGLQNNRGLVDQYRGILR